MKDETAIVRELRCALRGAKIEVSGSSNNGCRVELYFSGSGRMKSAERLETALKIARAPASKGIR